MPLPSPMTGVLTFVLAAAAATAPLPAQPQQHGASVNARATVVILRGGVNNEAGDGDALKRHVSRPEAARVTIAFE